MTGRRPVVAGRAHHGEQGGELARALRARIAALVEENQVLRLALAVAGNAHRNPPLPEREALPVAVAWRVPRPRPGGHR